jgi:hypothetical protein
VDKQALLKRLETMFDEIACNHSWANVEIEFRDGVANMIRSTKNEKLIAAQETNRARYESR